MTICTAFNSAYREMGEMCLRSIADLCIRHPANKMVCGFISDDFGYPHSWFKIGLIRSLLPCSDYVLWLDADTLLVGNESPYLFIHHEANVTISKDINGINCGVMAWANSPGSFRALTRITELRDQFKDHQWWEQAALATFIDELPAHYQLKHIFNAYPDEVTADTQIVHFAGVPHPDRLTAMTQFDQQRRC